MPPYEVVISADAEQDLLRAAGWYESIVAGLGNRFILQIEKSVDSICSYPLSFSTYIRYPEVRRKIVFGFPYLIFYNVKGSGIFILAVVHSRKKKKFISKRLR